MNVAQTSPVQRISVFAISTSSPLETTATIWSYYFCSQKEFSWIQMEESKRPSKVSNPIRSSEVYRWCHLMHPLSLQRRPADWPEVSPVKIWLSDTNYTPEKIIICFWSLALLTLRPCVAFQFQAAVEFISETKRSDKESAKYQLNDGVLGKPYSLCFPWSSAPFHVFNIVT